MKKLNFLCSELSGTGGTETVLVKVLNHLVNKYDITLTLSNEPEKREWLERLDSKVKVLTFKGNNNLAKLVFISKIFLFSSNTDFVSLSPKMILIGNKLRKIFKKSTGLYHGFTIRSQIKICSILNTLCPMRIAISLLVESLGNNC